MITALILGLMGCAEDLALERSADAVDTATPSTEVQLFWLDVYPTIDNLDGALVLPHSFGPFVEGEGFALRMEPAVTLRGQITGDRPTAWLPATLPTEATSVFATVRLVDSLGVVQAESHTDASGNYLFDATPGSWRLTISPEDPRLPASEQTVLLIDDQTLDIDLGSGVPLWGRVLDANGAGLPGVGVFATSAAGAETATTSSDAGGWYELRVGAGDWGLAVAGRETGRDPLLRPGMWTVGEGGLRLDVGYAHFVSVDLSGRTVDHHERALAGVRVQVRSLSIDGYEEGIASYSVELRSDSRGIFDTRLPAGVYEVAVLPDDADALTPHVQPLLDLHEDLDLGTITLESFRQVQSVITDPAGLPLAGATVRCEEVAPDPRSWITSTANDGGFTMLVPSIAMRCVFGPPGEYPDLADLRLLEDGTGLPWPIALPNGEPVSGIVTFGPDNLPLPQAIVSVRAENGQVWGYGPTDDEGAFDISVAW